MSQFKPKNEIWKLRLKHGRDRIIQNPEELWENFVQYAQYINDHPFVEQNWVGKEGDEVGRFRMRPMLKPEFAAVCGLSKWEYIGNLKSVSTEFKEIVTRIETTISSYNVSGSAAGFLNSNIIARVEGLTEKSEQSINLKSKPDWMKDDNGSEQES